MSHASKMFFQMKPGKHEFLRNKSTLLLSLVSVHYSRKSIPAETTSLSENDKVNGIIPA